MTDVVHVHNTEGQERQLPTRRAVAAAHVCVYIDSFCRLDGRHGGVPDPDPGDANAEDFRVQADRDGDLSLRCPHYARGCWWEVEVGEEDRPAPGQTLGEYRAVAQAHLDAEHHRIIDAEVPDAATPRSADGCVTPER